MKILFHVVAALAGLALAGLIVALVFGTASREGARQDGRAPSGLDASGGSLCGTIPPARTATPAARRQALAHQPTIVSPTGQQVSIDSSTAGGRAQLAWVARVQASAGLCVDELHIGDVGGRNEISMSTVPKVSPAAASAYAGGAVAAANTAPLASGRTLQLTTFVGNDRRTIIISPRAWRAYAASHPHAASHVTAHDLVLFRRTVTFGPADLRITGWT